MSERGFHGPPMTFTYKTYRIDPTSPNFLFLAGKYSALSLLALTTDPGSFGMAYVTEAAFAPADWMKRVSHPDVHVFVCVAHPSILPLDSLTLETGAWIGMVTQIGPTPKEIYWLTESGAPEPLDDVLETHWHQTATWVDPAHRGRGLARQLIDAGVSFAAGTITGKVQQARVRAFTGPHNEASQLLYGKLGFPRVGKCTPGEGMIANGNADYPFLGRNDWDQELMNLREGVILERLVKRKDLESKN